MHGTTSLKKLIWVLFDRASSSKNQHLLLLMMGIGARNLSSQEYLNKITLLQQVGISY